MDSLHSTMNQHVTGKHLSFEERVIIQTRLKDGCSIRAIARELGCSPSTISMKSDGALFLSITASRSATRLIRAKAFIK
ncbi:Transposase [Lactobacillus helveticus CIRM-BIA 101]|nr:Transposase [Lactobacillus helveticus CIRM-BIA 101]